MTNKAAEARAFRGAVNKLKKENEALFHNQVGFILHRIRDLQERYIPAEALSEFERLDPNLLEPADLDLLFEFIDECGKLSAHAADWHTKLKEKFCRRPLQLVDGGEM
jgi:hypothetical protein